MSLDAVNKAVTILNSHSGRDSINKVFHYASRIFSWYYLSRGMKSEAEHCEKFRLVIGEARRVARFFSSVTSIPSIVHQSKAIASSDSREALIANVGLLAAHLADFGYYISDNMTFAAGYNFIRLSGPTIEWLYVSLPVMTHSLFQVITWLVSILGWFLSLFGCCGL
eukprot:TRINITY_DN1958_c0_g2_i2.p1 TRINITY_DN1958_c0_g2~~TRINITY_DN1958_c0_g2_i2.p1  ORF type:complete len:167 (+),score=18.27 TRINITY_DN1958_c0_g2_i2:72-572(+)